MRLLPPLRTGPGRRLLWMLLAFAGAALALPAQSVRWEAGDSGLGNSLLLIFENCEPEGQPALPAIPGVTFTPAGRSESTNIVNFSVSRTIALSYVVRGPQNPPLQIPAFTVRTSKGDLPVAAFNVAAPAAPLDSLARARLLPARPTVWAGEVFGLTYELSAARRTNPQISPTFDWNPAPLAAEDWSKPEVTEAVANGDRRVNVTFRTRAVAKVPNRLKLEAASHLISIQTGTIGFGIISQPRMEQVAVPSDQPVLEVRPLPSGAPAGFGGAVGQFKLVSRVVPERAAVGEPVTWTLELTGTGNWPDLGALPARTVSQDFQVVQPKAKRVNAEGKLFDATLTEDVVLVPTKAGEYALGPVSFSYFDPQAGAYRTITAPRTTLAITGAPVPRFNVTPPDPANDPGAAAVAAPAPREVTPAAAPAGIPRDPLAGEARAAIPFTARSLGWALAAPGLAVFAWWLALAYRRARNTDPLRPRRVARARLAGHLAALARAGAGDRRGPLLAWQQDTARLWGLEHAAPSSRALAAAAAPGDGGAEAWLRLWQEADQALYGPRPELPADWLDRAQTALAVRRVPGFRPWTLLRPRNLMPFAASLVLWAGLAGTALEAAAAAAAEPTGLYRRGDFTGAEKAWRGGVEQAPGNWIARHNLSLALEQLDRNPEAAAHAAAAFVQQPDHEAVRWHFAHAAGRGGMAPAELVPFLQPDLWRGWARHASPAIWEWAAVVAAWLAAAGLAGVLTLAYRGGGPRGRRVAWTGFALGLLGTSCALVGSLAYGRAAHPAAAIVARTTVLRSIPTEADTSQKTTPLTAGGLAKVEGSFLGWRRIAFPNGQTGWVRREDLVPIWR
ncbi:MAG: BatD family protein [Opitutaceae bacterium]